jgi:AraC-like DNA-binding protein
MITIRHSYGADLDWINSYAKQFNAKIEDNFIIVPEDISTGSRYFLDLGEDTVAFYIDAMYHTEIHFIQAHLKTDFIALYYDLTEGKAIQKSNNFSYETGHFGYNFFIIDSILETEYFLSKGTKTFILCVFIKKRRVEFFAKKHSSFFTNIDKIMDPEKNTFIKFDRMAPESYHTLVQLKKLEIGTEIFNLQLSGAVHLLISNLINQMLTNTIIIEKVNKDDLSSIISIQNYLINSLEKPFPSIKLLARTAYMSESKFKILFTKITGTTPNSFFMTNKLLKAKELLQEQHFSITEVCNELNFTNYSYFIFKFREHFGLPPNVFVKKL